MRMTVRRIVSDDRAPRALHSRFQLDDESKNAATFRHMQMPKTDVRLQHATELNPPHPCILCTDGESRKVRGRLPPLTLRGG